MSDQNKHNILYFESVTMSGLYQAMESWQQSNKKRFLSMSVQQDSSSGGTKYCCIALTNPSEVIIVDGRGVPGGVRVRRNRHGGGDLSTCSRGD